MNYQSISSNGHKMAMSDGKFYIDGIEIKSGGFSLFLKIKISILAVSFFGFGVYFGVVLSG